MTVRIVTDSSCDLPQAVAERYGVYVLPLHINIGKENYLDGVNLSRDEFYANLADYPQHPTTAVPSPMKFRAMYDTLAESGATEVLSIHISNTLSGVVNMAKKAAEETTSVPVTVIDSGQLSLGAGFLVETAARLAQEGKTVAQIIPVLREQIQRTHTFAALDTLVFLRRSGRMNAALSAIGELLQLKPILNMYAGKSSAERVRTRKQAMQRIKALFVSYAPYEKVAILHSAALERAQELLEEVKGLLPQGEVLFEQINPALGAHIGSGVVGFACISKSQPGGAA